MNKIERMLQELCPEGVEYKKLGEVCGKVKNIKWKDIEEGRIFSYIDLTSVDTLTHSINGTITISKGNAPSRAQQIVEENDILFGTTRPTLMRYCIIPKQYNEQICSTGYCVLRPNSKLVLNRFVYHIISSQNFELYVGKHQQGAGYPSITDQKIFDFEIPVPPLPIQEEIVRILDHFTELTAELQAELQARQEQYEYYRNKLLTFDAGSVTWMKMNEIAEIGTGNSNRQDAIADGAYPFFVRSKNVFNSNTYEFDEEAVIIPGEGGIGDIFHYVKGKYALHQRVYRIHLLNDKVSARFLYYYMSSQFKEFIMKKAVSATVTSIRKPMIEKFEIPIIPLTEQQRIVSILDKFESLVNDLFQGLPAEIAAVQEQYEYYRNKLLTFKRIA